MPLRILYIVPYVPTPIRTRPYNLVSSLAARGHEVTLATVWSNVMERTTLDGLRERGVRVLAVRLTPGRSLWNCLLTLPRPTPLQSVYCWQPQLLRLVQSELQAAQPHFDIVHVEHLRGARYGTHLQAAMSSLSSRALPPVVWDSVDCISYLFEQAARLGTNQLRRMATRIELPRTRWYEAWLVSQFDRVLVTSDQDLRAFGNLLQEFAPSSDGHIDGLRKLNVLPNGVDLDYFAPRTAPRATRTLVFTGKMSYHANVAAALYLVNGVMPLVWEKYPEARVQIVGQNPPNQILNLGRRNPERVVVTGRVEDLRPFLAEATLAVAPLTYGAGIQNKVLEAMAMQTPVVATTRAVSALSIQTDQEVLIGDDTEVFSQHIIRMLRNRGLRERLGASGRQYVELHHDWRSITGQLENIYQQASAEQKSLA